MRTTTTRSPTPTLLLALALALASGAVTGCGDPDVGGEPSADGARDAPDAPGGADEAAGGAGDSAVVGDAGDRGRGDTAGAVDPNEPGGAPPVTRVWLNEGETLVAVERPEAGDSLRGALTALVAGPTAGERARGLTSWFGEETRGVIREVRVEAGRAIVDFDEGMATLIPGAASSAGSGALLGALDSTVFQFPTIDAVEYRLGGSCARFWEWLQRECEVVRR